MNQTQKTYKIILVGDGGVGKTSFIKRYTGIGETFERGYVATLGVGVYHTTYIHPNGQMTHFEVWDTDTQNKLPDFFYMNAQACILMYDCTSWFSVKSLHYWRKCAINISSNIKFIVCKTKHDLNGLEDWKVRDNIKNTILSAKRFTDRYEYAHISVSEHKRSFDNLLHQLVSICNTQNYLQHNIIINKPKTEPINYRRTRSGLIYNKSI